MKLHTFYNENQNVENNDSFSPSAGKPRLFVERIRSYSEVQIISNFHPVEEKLLYEVHMPYHVHETLVGRRANGFGNTSLDIAKSLLWTNASFTYAAINAVKLNTVTMSPTSGFHHASWKTPMGFCTFNGLMLAAVYLKKKGLANKIGILDLDAHYGNGTDDIINHLDIDYINHYTFGGVIHQFEDAGYNKIVEDLPKTLEKMFSNVDVILYQAGADPHINDPLGGYLTTKELALRDDIVFNFTSKNNIPIAWNLAGGYQDPVDRVLDIHENTLRACISNY